jgi:ankyrin repeat protein
MGRTDLVKLFISNGADCTLNGSKGKAPIALARQLGLPKLEDLITDSLGVLHCLKKLGLERKIQAFLDQEIYLYHLEDIPDYWLMKLLDSKEEMDKIKNAAREYNSRSLNRKETFFEKTRIRIKKT